MTSASMANFVRIYNTFDYLHTTAFTQCDIPLKPRHGPAHDKRQDGTPKEEHESESISKPASTLVPPQRPPQRPEWALAGMRPFSLQLSEEERILKNIYCMQQQYHVVMRCVEANSCSTRKEVVTGIKM